MTISPVLFQDSNVSMEDLLSDKDLFVADIKLGSIVQGKVVAFQGEWVIIDLGSKSEGRVLLKEFDEKPNKGLHIEAILRSKDKESGLLNLSKKELEQRRGWEIVKEAHEKDIQIYGFVKKAMKQGYLVNVEGVSMFLPHSQVGLLNTSSKRGKKQDIIGSNLPFKILELTPKRHTGVISRKAYQDEQNDQNWQKLFNEIKIGDIVSGKVVKHTKSGAFVSIKDVEGFLHKSNISWERKNDNFREKIPLESEIQVRVLEIDLENHRFSLGLKQMNEDPWLKVNDHITVGESVSGKVTFVANYGAFVDLGGGLEGLLHVSEMSWTRKINHAKEFLKEDQEIQTRIIALNPEEKRISLSLRQLEENPWEALQQELKVGQVLKSKVKDVTNFGLFVSITDSIDGLIRKEDINWEEPPIDPRKTYKSGDEVEFKITEINLEERKVGCSIRHLLLNPYKELKTKYPRGTVIEGEVSGIVDFGIFIRFADSFEGLAHLSTMSREQAGSLKKSFTKGEKIKAVIKSIDHENRKISLSLRDVNYALERMEIQQYLDKNEYLEPVSSPFKDLKNLI